MTERRAWPGGEASFLVGAALLCSAAIIIPSLPGFWARPEVMAAALTLDLALGLPALGYLFVVRRRPGTAWILGPLFLSGLGLARWWVPGGGQGRVAELLLVSVEGCVLTWLAFRGRALAAQVRTRQARGASRADAVRGALVEILGERVGGAVFTEASILWYSLAGWRRPRPDAAGRPAFPLHRRGGYPALLGALLLALTAETAAVHLLLHLWSPTAAWLATALSVWSALWLLGDFHAARHNPTTADDEGLKLRVGLRWRVDLPWKAVRSLDDGPAPEAGVALTLLGPPDFWLHLHRPVTVRGPLGIRRSTTALGLAADQPGALRDLVEARLVGGAGTPP